MYLHVAVIITMLLYLKLLLILNFVCHTMSKTTSTFNGNHTPWRQCARNASNSRYLH